VDNHEQPSRCGVPDRHHAHLIYRMERICDRTGEWIAEHSRRLIEGDTVPCQVAGGLDRIPFELHASIVLLAPLLLPAAAERKQAEALDLAPVTPLNGTS